MKSEDKRNGLLEAAVRVIALQGLSAPTAMIAKEAGVANGSLFTYFETKTELFNQLYLELKTNMITAAFEGCPDGADMRTRLFHMWTNWMRWAVSNSDSRKVLAILDLSDEINMESRTEGHKIMADFAAMVRQIQADGPMKEAPFGLVISIMNKLADATMDFMIQDSVNAEMHIKTGFEAVWRVIA